MLILIDFEKAFVSVSWTFIYQTLEFLGFGESFINWIKLFDTEVKATIIQCGFLSIFIDIEMGCHQGDPILSYLFILTVTVTGKHGSNYRLSLSCNRKKAKSLT